MAQHTFQVFVHRFEHGYHLWMCTLCGNLGRTHAPGVHTKTIAKRVFFMHHDLVHPNDENKFDVNAIS